MSIVCACVASLPVAVARLHGAAADGEALIVVDRLERGRVVACDDGAYAQGARTGMTLVQASSRARDARIAVDDPRRNHEFWQRVLDALDAASPLVEDHAPGVAFLEMRGIPGSPAQRIAAVRAALAPSGLPFRAAWAANKRTAQLAALACDGAIVAAGDEARMLAPLALRVLALDDAAHERLTLLGIRTLGELAALPHGDFTRRFGPQSARWHDHARGIDRSPIAPRPRALRIERSVFGEGSAESEAQVLFALRALLAELTGDLAAAGMRAGRLRLLLECEDGETQDFDIGVARPTAQDALLFDLVRAKLEGARFTSPVCGVRLSAEQLEEGGGAMSLFRGDDPDLDAIATTIARLCAALGPEAALQPATSDAHRREARFVDVPVDARMTRTGFMHMSMSEERAVTAYRIVPRRPVRVECVEGLPVGVDARRVLDAAGPWRFHERWWALHMPGDAPHAGGEEYDVLLEGGHLWRIAREAGAWSLRGVYD